MIAGIVLKRMCPFFRCTSVLVEDSILGVRLDNLIARYEEPSSMVRWDSPLFTVPWSESDVPIESIWRAITEGNVKPPNVGTQAVGDPSRIFVSSNPYSFRIGAESTF
jgi:Chromatin associated protein KTI12